MNTPFDRTRGDASPERESLSPVARYILDHATLPPLDLFQQDPDALRRLRMLTGQHLVRVHGWSLPDSDAVTTRLDLMAARFDDDAAPENDADYWSFYAALAAYPDLETEFDAAVILAQVPAELLAAAPEPSGIPWFQANAALEESMEFLPLLGDAESLRVTAYALRYRVYGDEQDATNARLIAGGEGLSLPDLTRPTRPGRWQENDLALALGLREQVLEALAVKPVPVVTYLFDLFESRHSLWQDVRAYLRGGPLPELHSFAPSGVMGVMMGDVRSDAGGDAVNVEVTSSADRYRKEVSQGPVELTTDDDPAAPTVTLTATLTDPTVPAARVRLLRNPAPSEAQTKHFYDTGDAADLTTVWDITLTPDQLTDSYTGPRGHYDEAAGIYPVGQIVVEVEERGESGEAQVPDGG